MSKPIFDHREKDEVLTNLTKEIYLAKKDMAVKELKLKVAQGHYHGVINQLENYVDSNPDILEYELFGNGICFYKRDHRIIYVKYEPEVDFEKGDE